MNITGIFPNNYLNDSAIDFKGDESVSDSPSKFTCKEVGSIESIQREKVTTGVFIRVSLGFSNRDDGNEYCCYLSVKYIESTLELNTFSSSFYLIVLALQSLKVRCLTSRRDSIVV
ncbi:hypothetical protein LSM04_000755 [Trypanosoma melophagium]|uniref:uncharacterized protein n=1 Tax=Trypanosoma melophagium TaxID=715481 RepID=UPI00351A533B|nr:hypothetical protein LSM04_000755 [Trypanosoma melophagium]